MSVTLRQVMRTALLGLAATMVVGVGTAATQSARADETGLAQALHDVRKEGRKLCLVDHFHDGHAAGHPTRKKAESEAIAAWAGFTALEYGSSWGVWSRAASRSMTCNREGAGWACHATGRPCR